MVAAYCFALEFFNRKQHDTWVEKAYRHAIELDETDAYMWANLARLQAFRGNRSEATDNYRKTLACMSGNEDALYAIELRMQTHLWLENRDLAAQALDALAQSAGAGDASPFTVCANKAGNVMP